MSAQHRHARQSCCLAWLAAPRDPTLVAVRLIRRSVVPLLRAPHFGARAHVVITAFTGGPSTPTSTPPTVFTPWSKTGPPAPGSPSYPNINSRSAMSISGVH